MAPEEEGGGGEEDRSRGNGDQGMSRSRTKDEEHNAQVLYPAWDRISPRVDWVVMVEVVRHGARVAARLDGEGGQAETLC